VGTILQLTFACERCRHVQHVQTRRPMVSIDQFNEERRRAERAEADLRVLIGRIDGGRE
jgi:hypothetical protein